VFVTPEYNRGIPAALKNAIDYLFAEWSHKAAGFVGHGTAGGARAIEQLRLVLGELHVADARSQVLLSLFTGCEACTTFTPAQVRETTLDRVISEVIAWGSALKSLRAAGEVR
jgi:NAD(P)H-dependent FMN reductase